MRRRNIYHAQPQEGDELEQIPEEQPQRAHDQGLEVKNLVLKITLLCLYLIDVLLSFGTLFYVTKQANQISTLILQSLEFVAENLRADPIMEIQIIDGKSTCPSGFQVLRLASWPGTIAGCLCDNGDLHRSSCDEIDFENCKTDVPSLLK